MPMYSSLLCLLLQAEAISAQLGVTRKPQEEGKHGPLGKEGFSRCLFPSAAMLLCQTVVAN